jgi:inositol 1,4,5-triphosphate receptor type 1
MQVQLLVSEADVENYKQIKQDLDRLRLLVEKSELWVYKSKSEGSKKDDGDDDDSERVSGNGCCGYVGFPWLCNAT